MKVEIEKLPSLKLTMANEEAVWLMNFIQNYPLAPESEDTKYAKFRKDLFEQLRGYLT